MWSDISVGKSKPKYESILVASVRRADNNEQQSLRPSSRTRYERQSKHTHLFFSAAAKEAAAVAIAVSAVTVVRIQKGGSAGATSYGFEVKKKSFRGDRIGVGLGVRMHRTRSHGLATRNRAIMGKN